MRPPLTRLIQYLVELKVRGGGNSWEEEADMSRARIIEFEGESSLLLE